MKNLLFCILFLCYFLTSCMSIHYKNLSKVVEFEGEKSGLLISTELDDGISNNNFGMLYFTFENTSDKYIRIDDFKFDFADSLANDNIYIVAGDDLDAWQSGIQLKTMVDNYNRAMVHLGILGMATAVALATSDDNDEDESTISPIGAVALLGAATIANIDNANMLEKESKLRQLYPESHIYHSTIVVPPGLAIRKWILFHSTNNPEIPFVYKLYFDFKKDDGGKEKHYIKFRPSIYEAKKNPVWQKSQFNKFRYIR